MVHGDHELDRAERASKVLGLEAVSDLAEFYACQWTSTIKQFLSLNNWVDVSDQNLKFDLVLRHGSDSADQLTDLNLSNESPRVVFGGSGGAYFKNPGLISEELFLCF